jgi:hypothetical protein
MLGLKVNYFFTEKNGKNMNGALLTKRRLIICDWKKTRRFKLTNVNGENSAKAQRREDKLCV